MSLAIFFHFLCAQHVSNVNIPIIRSLQLCCWITTSVVLFSVRCVLETTDVVIQQHSCKLLMMGILMSEACWAHKKWNKIASDIKLVFHSSKIFQIYKWTKCFVLPCITRSTERKVVSYCLSHILLAGYGFSWVIYLLSKVGNRFEDGRSSLVTDHTATGHSESCKCSSGPRNTLNIMPIINRIYFDLYK